MYTTDHTFRRQSITRAKLVYDVAKSVKRFLEVRCCPTETYTLASEAITLEGEGKRSRRSLGVQLERRVAGEDVPHPPCPRFKCLVAARDFRGTVTYCNDAGVVVACLDNTVSLGLSSKLNFLCFVKDSCDDKLGTWRRTSPRPIYRGNELGHSDEFHRVDSVVDIEEHQRDVGICWALGMYVPMNLDFRSRSCFFPRSGGVGCWWF